VGHIIKKKIIDKKNVLTMVKAEGKANGTMKPRRRRRKGKVLQQKREIKECYKRNRYRFDW
jgi:hypothetical protein